MLIYKKEIKPAYEPNHVNIVRTVSLYKSIFSREENRLIRSKKGECVISGLARKTDDTDCLSYGSTCSMTISIDDECRQLGYSREMLACMIKNIEREWPEIPFEKMFFIDADASSGFWDHIGFVENRYGYDYFGLRELEGKGYEKNVTLGDLKAFVTA
jgi:hypothetical protein